MPPGSPPDPPAAPSEVLPLQLVKTSYDVALASTGSDSVMSIRGGGLVTSSIRS